MTIKVKLEKEDWLNGRPRQCDKCVFAARLSKLIPRGDYEDMSVAIEREGEVRVIIGEIDQGYGLFDHESCKFFEIKGERAAEVIVDFDNLYKNAPSYFGSRIEDTEEARLALYEKYKDYEWELIQVVEPVDA